MGAMIMFGIGLGEILLIIFAIFLISPKDIPRVMKKIGQFFNTLNEVKKEITDLADDVEDIVKDAKIENEILIDSNIKKIKKTSIKRGYLSKKKK